MSGWPSETTFPLAILSKRQSDHRSIFASMIAKVQKDSQYHRKVLMHLHARANSIKTEPLASFDIAIKTNPRLVSSKVKAAEKKQKKIQKRKDETSPVVQRRRYRMLRSKGSRTAYSFSSQTDMDSSTPTRRTPSRLESDSDGRVESRIGPDYQADFAHSPSFGCDERDDQLLWSPSQCPLSESQLDAFLHQAQNALLATQRNRPTARASPSSLDTQIASSSAQTLFWEEESLIALHESSHDPRKAMSMLCAATAVKRRRQQDWSNSEVRAFSVGASRCQKDLPAIQEQYVKTKDLGAVVRFYYLWHGLHKQEKRVRLAESEASAKRSSQRSSPRPPTPSSEKQ